MNNVIHFQNIETSDNKNVALRNASFDSPINNSIAQQTGSVHPLASVTGNVRLGKRVVVAPGASVRGYQSQPIWVGDDAKILDGSVVQALGHYCDREFVESAVVEVEGEFYGVYIGDGVSLTPQSQVHGPASIGANTFVGMQSLVFKAIVGSDCIIEPKALVMGVEIGDGRHVHAGAMITTQEQADNLPYIDSYYNFKDFTPAAVKINNRLVTDYLKRKDREQKLA